MRDEKRKSSDLPAPTIRSRDSQGSPAAILAIALAGGIGYFAWKTWKRRQEVKRPERDASGVALEEGKSLTGESKGKGTFDKQPKSAASGSASTSTSGRPAAAASSSSGARRPSRQDPKPKSQKQLRKEAKQAKKAAREQATRDAEGAAVSAAIAKRAKELGMGQQPPEPAKQYYVDYDGVTKAYDKIVEWQQTGKKKF